MTTWRVLALFAALFVLLSLVSLWWQPVDDLHGRTPLVWVSDNSPARAAEISTFDRENPLYQLQLDYNNKGMQKILLQSSSGVGPDLFDLYSGELQTYVEAGVLWDITDEAAAKGIAPTKSWPGMEGQTNYQGRQYGYPANIGTCILIYNKNVFDYYGVPYPDKIETWDQLIELGRKVSTEGTGKPGLDGPILGIARLAWQYFFASAHGEFFDASGHLAIVGNAALKRAFEYHRDVIFKYKLTPTAVELKSMGGQGGWGSADFNQFSSNKFAMILTGNYSLIAFDRTYEEQMKELATSGKKLEDIKNPLEKPLRLGAILLPGFAGETPGYEVSCRLVGINPFSPRRKEALAFLQYLAGPSYSKLVNEGNDALPGNSQYADLGAHTETNDLSEQQMHQVTVDALNHGYTMRDSPFLLRGEVAGVLQAEISRMESNPALNLDDLINDAQGQLERLVRRHVGRDPALKNLYDQPHPGVTPASTGASL